MWSYEKINLSMMLLITGKLVACYDEEFRRLFARSNVPTLLVQQMTPKTDHQVLSTNNQGLIHGLHSSPFFQRSQSFDPTQLNTIRGRLNMLNHNDRPEEGTHANGATMNHALNLLRNPITNTYTGFQHRLYSSLRQRNQVVGETGVDVLDRNPFSPQLNNQVQYRQPAQDDSSLYAQPSFLSSSELSLHRWRIESYLKNDQVPADSTESLDCMSLRSESRSSLLSPHSSRPNLILKGLEQPVLSDLKPMQSPILGRRTITSVYTSLQKAKENGRDSKVELERKLSVETKTPHAGQTQVTGLLSPSTEIQRPLLRTSELLPSLPETNSQSVPENKQETEADNSKLISPTPSSVQSPEGSIITDTNEEVAEASKDETPTAQKLTESHRSVSHHDMKIIEDKKTPQSYVWQEPPSRTVSTSHLGTAVDSSILKASNLKRLRPFSDSNKARLSLIEIPEEKESIDSGRTTEETSSSKDADAQSLTTLTKTQPTPIEANVHISEKRPSIPIETITSPTPSCSSRDWASPVTTPVVSQPTNPTWGALKRAQGELNVAASPRTLSALDVVGDTHHRVDRGSQSSVATVESVMSNPGEGRYGIPEVKRNKVYSRFEHFLSVERRAPDKTDSERTQSHTHTYTTEKRRSLFMGASVYSRYQTPTQTDNKRFGKFIQRVGNFISKNK